MNEEKIGKSLRYVKHISVSVEYWEGTSLLNIVPRKRVILVAGSDCSPRSSSLNVSNEVALVHLSLRLFQSMIVRGINECL